MLTKQNDFYIISPEVFIVLLYVSDVYNSYVSAFYANTAQCDYTANVHLLVHLADCVRCSGPLLVHSAFPFEDANGWLNDQFRGTRDPEKQVLYVKFTYIIIVKKFAYQK